MFKMLELQMLEKIDSWAIRWYYNQFILGMYTVYPTKSKIINDGFSDEKGTHNSGANNKWVVELDNEKINFKDINIKNAGFIIMTEKDAVKCRRFADERHWFLQVEAELNSDFGESIKRMIP